MFAKLESTQSKAQQNMEQTKNPKIRATNILTSTKKASLIITDFLAMIYKNEQPRTASLWRGWAMLENDFNLICRWRVIPMTPYRLNVYTWRHCASIAFDFNLNLHPVCAVNVLLNNEQILDLFFKQLWLRVMTLWNYDVTLKTKCKVRLRNLPTFSFCFK